MNCDSCRSEILDESYNLYGKILCEDCYVAAVQPPRPCDPTAVSAALSSRRTLGQTGDQGLTAVQKRIYNYIKEKGRVKSEELPGVLGLSPREVEVQFAVLRHCGLVGAKKEEDGIYVTPLG